MYSCFCRNLKKKIISFIHKKMKSTNGNIKPSENTNHISWITFVERVRESKKTTTTNSLSYYSIVYEDECLSTYYSEKKESQLRQTRTSNTLCISILMWNVKNREDTDEKLKEIHTFANKIGEYVFRGLDASNHVSIRRQLFVD